MKQEGHWSIFELDSLPPFEFEIYYYMVLNDFKERREEILKQREEMERLSRSKR